MSERHDPFAPGLLRRLVPPPRKVVVLRASRVGDFLCTIPALRALREALPEAEITLVTLPLLRELVLRLPYVDRYAAFPGWPGIAEQLFDARAALRFLAEMQAEAFDLAIQIQGSGVNSNPFALLLGAQATAGFIRPGDGAGRLDAALPWPETGHEIERMLAMTTFLGAPPCRPDCSPSAPWAGTSVRRVDSRRTEFPLWPEDYAEAEVLLAQAEPPLIGIQAGARDATRRWPVERFAAVGRELHARHGGTLALLGDAGERDLVGSLAESLRGRMPRRAVLDLAGRTGLPALGAVIARMALLVTNDTGPAHIAYAQGTPSVTIFGGASPEAYSPPRDGPHCIAISLVPCRPRNGSTCPSCAYGLICLDRISVGEVVAQAEALLATQSLPSAQLSIPIPISRQEYACDAEVH